MDFNDGESLLNFRLFIYGVKYNVKIILSNSSFLFLCSDHLTSYCINIYYFILCEEGDGSEVFIAKLFSGK